MSEITAEEKVITLFNYIKELCDLRDRTVQDIRNQFWNKKISEIPINEKYITLNNRDMYDDTDYDDTILAVKKPTLSPCPTPDKIFFDWLNEGWDNPKKDISIQETMPKQSASAEEHTVQEAFADDTERVAAFEQWQQTRNDWATEQKELLAILSLFKMLYQLHITSNRDADSLELLIGSGMLTDRTNKFLMHPILLKRIKTQFDASENIVRIVDTDTTSELYTSLLTGIEDFCIDHLSSFAEELSIKNYHPLDSTCATEFLKQLLHTLSSDSQFIDSEEINTSERFQVRFEPVFFARARKDGASKTMEMIIKDIRENHRIPTHLVNLVGEGAISVQEDDREHTLSEQLAEVGGEDVDILLTKIANKEQLEIAQRISKYDAVLVQGPPGTGKTHTIANLLGHFLSQGKTVLVTSHTKKALTIVKEKVEEDLQDLCVTMLDDNHADMEKAVNGITDMLSKHPISEIKSKIEAADTARKTIISKLAAVRQQIYEIKNSEFSPIIIGGKNISPSEAAKFVCKHPEFNIIPGEVELYRVCPLSYEELQTLYSSNAFISDFEETELECDLPNPETFPTPEKFAELVNAEKKATKALEEICATKRYLFSENKDGLLLTNQENAISILTPSLKGLNLLKSLLENFTGLEDWMIYATTDGNAGGGHANNWNTLIAKLQETFEYSETLVEESFGKTIAFSDDADFQLIAKNLPSMISSTTAKGKIGKIKYLSHPEYKKVESFVTINGNSINSHADYVIIEHQLTLMKMRNECKCYWDELLASHGMKKYDDLHPDTPEAVAVNLIPQIQKYLAWYKNDYPLVAEVIQELGLSENQIFQFSTLDTNIEQTKKILNAINTIFPFVQQIVENYLLKNKTYEHIQMCFSDVATGNREKSNLCLQIKYSVQKRSIADYSDLYYNLKVVFDKHHTLKKRKELLDKLYAVAPDWSHAIRTRTGIHGKDIVPQNIMDAWLWKQYNGILNELSEDSFEKLQSDSIALSQQYRKKTAELAKWRSWYALKIRIENNSSLKDSLVSWELVTQKIGKAKKMNGIYRAEARKHMIACQQAVPVWIMPMAKAFENYTPGENTFDIVILDEASQSDISALAITYLAKKVIIVGDDKQVSPMAIGLELDQVIQLAEGTIKDIIPSWELYTEDTSIYDIVRRVYPTLMLCEHFRCVPDIIGYSNKLSYDYKIKPLRDISSCELLPSVINYRVNGHRSDAKKQNEVEVITIIALMKACFERSEYDGKTFGMISLLGDEQPKLFEKYLFENFDADEIEKRKIIYGTSAQFQGDERDIVFLSMVDSNESEGPLRKTGYGDKDTYRKRYNVAVSRAKDQLWLIHSLDEHRDLKDGDIRKGLIEYTKNPNAFQQQAEEISAHAESPFEEAVGKALVAKGYSLTQQFSVGSYRIDMVVFDGKNRVAIECDGEKWHSSELQVRNDMERQTILERLGWRFIRIRGSEYFRNPEKTMDSVYRELSSLHIHPTQNVTLETTPDTNLLAAIKARADEILAKDKTIEKLVNGQLFWEI